MNIAFTVVLVFTFVMPTSAQAVALRGAVPFGTPSVAASSQQGHSVSIDNSQSNKAATGRVVDSAGWPTVVVALKNEHTFWLKVSVKNVINDVAVLSDDPHTNTWAKFGYIAPNSEAVYALRLDPARDSVIQFFVNAGRTDDGSPSAAELTMLQRTIDVILTGVGATKDFQDADAQQLLDAIAQLNKLPDCVNAVDGVLGGNPGEAAQFATRFQKCLTDPKQAAVLAAIASQFGVTVTTQTLKDVIFTPLKLLNLVTEVSDTLAAIVTGSWAGSIVVNGIVIHLPQSPIATPSTIQIGSTVIVNDNNVALRSAPSTDSPIIATLARGTELTIIAPAQQGGGFTWWPVSESGTNTIGYIRADYLTPRGANQTAPITVTQLPQPGTVLYAADWSTGSSGWTGDPNWKIRGGMLASDSSTDGLPLPNTPAASSMTVTCGCWKAPLAGLAVAPFQPNIADYAIEAEIMVVGSEVDSSFGLVSKDGLATVAINGGNYAVPFIGTDELPGTPFDYGSAWHTYRLEVKGDNMRFLIDGVVMLNLTDQRLSSISDGRVGLYDQYHQIVVRSFKVVAL